MCIAPNFRLIQEIIECDVCSLTLLHFLNTFGSSSQIVSHRSTCLANVVFVYCAVLASLFTLMC